MVAQLKGAYSLICVHLFIKQVDRAADASDNV